VSDNCSDEEEENVNVGLGGESNKFVWQNIDSFPDSRETLCDVNVPQFDTAELDITSALENIMQLIVDKTNRYAQQEISKSINPFTFHSRIRQWEDVIVDEMHVALALCTLMGIVQKPTFTPYYSKNWLLFTPVFFLRLYPWKD
jgi:hypothetical protein